MKNTALEQFPPSPWKYHVYECGHSSYLNGFNWLDDQKRQYLDTVPFVTWKVFLAFAVGKLLQEIHLLRNRMKRPKTYRASELWDENWVEQMSAECPRTKLIRRRRGRPPTETARARWHKCLQLIRLAYEAGAEVQEIAGVLGIPEGTVTPFLVEVSGSRCVSATGRDRYLKALQHFAE